MEKKMKDLNALLVEKFKNKEFEKKYHRTAALFRLADEVLLLRRKRGLTQKELAVKVGTTQAVVSRLENASVKPSLETIIKIAEALDAVVNVQLLPIETIRLEEKPADVENKKQEAAQGIRYYDFEHGTLQGWDEKWISSKDPSLPGIPKSSVAQAMVRKIRMKIREFA
jgi:transcriptional regulator with XRE-family HTH domain